MLPYLNMFLKSKKEKEKLRIEMPELYEEFSLIWSIRDWHMVDDLPSQYLFYLLPCYSRECEHPVCRAGKASSEFTWFKDGPPLTYLPLPVPDEKRSWGINCEKCSPSPCYGHYMDPKEAVNHIDSCSLPPSVEIAKFFKEFSAEPSPTAIDDLAKKVFLSPEEVSMWLQHLKTVQINRTKGAGKAQEQGSSNYSGTLREYCR